MLYSVGGSEIDALQADVIDVNIYTRIPTGLGTRPSGHVETCFFRERATRATERVCGGRAHQLIFQATCNYFSRIAMMCKEYEETSD